MDVWHSEASLWVQRTGGEIQPIEAEQHCISEFETPPDTLDLYQAEVFVEQIFFPICSILPATNSTMEFQGANPVVLGGQSKKRACPFGSEGPVATNSSLELSTKNELCLLGSVSRVFQP